MNMNGVDRADQLRTYYSFLRGLRQPVWWWSIFMWSMEIAMVNSYLLYSLYHKMHGYKPVSHYQFQKEVAMSWLDDTRYWPGRYPRKNPRRSRGPISTPSTISTSSRSRTSRKSRSTKGSRSTKSPRNILPKKRKCVTIPQDLRKMNGRLEINSYTTHLPELPFSKHSECQLHKWAAEMADEGASGRTRK